MIDEREEYFDKSTTDPNDALAEEQDELINITIPVTALELIKEILIGQYEEAINDDKFSSIGYQTQLHDACWSLGMKEQVNQILKDYKFDKTKSK